MLYVIKIIAYFEYSGYKFNNPPDIYNDIICNEAKTTPLLNFMRRVSRSFYGSFEHMQ